MQTAQIEEISNEVSKPLREGADVIMPRPRFEDEAKATEFLQGAPSPIQHSSGGRVPLQETPSLIRPSSGGKVPLRRFKILKQWEGIVSEVTTDSFWAEITDANIGSRTEEIVELPLSEIDDADHCLLSPGAVFYWTIGYEDSPSGRLRVSEIRLRRSPKWSQKQIDSIAQKSHQLFELWSGNDEGSTTESK